MNLLKTKDNLKTIIAFLFVLSGAAGLIYQIIWFKFLALFLGNSTYAQMTVLATFLGGLALGNNYFGRTIDRYGNPLKIYGLLELIVGLYCIFYPSLNSATGNLFIYFSSSMGLNPESVLFNLLRFLASAILLIFPTFAMGGTLPVLSQFFVDDLRNARRDMAILYYLNSFGAVSGVLIGGFFLIETLGLTNTIYLAAAINIAVGTITLLVSKNESAAPLLQPQEFSDSAIKPTNEEEPVSKQTAVAVIIVAGISGMAALLYEMVWTRLLINVFGSSTYAFSIMLMAFISGITLGGWLISKKTFSKFDKIKLLALLQFLIGLFTMAVLLLFNRLPYFLWNISHLFSKTEEAFPLFLSIEFLICFILILFPTLFMGMSLPLAVEIVSAMNKKIGLTVGSVFSVNTFGNVLGVLISAMLLIPLFGIHNTFLIGVGLNFFAAVFVLFFYKKPAFREKVIYASSTVIIFIIYLFAAGSFNQDAMISGVFKMFKEKPPESYEKFLDLFKYEKIIYYKEGSAATVAVTQWTDNPANKRLIINGKPDASSFLDMPTQILLGQLPMMLQKNPKNVFVVGLGTGTTVGSVLTHSVKEVVCAEISKGVIEASKFFENENQRCLDDPRLKLYNEDAVTLLKISKDKFDVIISEPSNPWIAGIGNLFSREYFTNCYNKLSDDGIMVQWFHLYEADDETVKLVLNTFSSVFDYCQLWSSVGSDMLLVGSKKDIRPDFELLEKKFEQPKVKKDFERININNLFTLLCNQAASPKNFFAMSNSFPINTEIRPMLEFVAPKAQYVSKQSYYIYSFDEKFDTLSNSLLVKDYIKFNKPGREELINAADYSFNESQNIRFAYGLSKYILSLYPDDFKTNQIYAESYDVLEINKGGDETLQKLAGLYPDSLSLQKQYANHLLLQKTNASTFMHVFSIEDQANLFLKYSKEDTLSQVKTIMQVALAYLKNGEIERANSLCIKMEEYLKDSSQVSKKILLDDYYYTAAITALYKQDVDRVFVNYLALINTNPDYKNLPKLRRLTNWYLKFHPQFGVF